MTKARQLATIGILAALWPAYSDISVLWANQQSGQPASGWPGTLMLFLYVTLLVMSAGILIISVWWPQWMRRIGNRGEKFAWPLAAIFILLLAWLHLFSPLQGVVTGAWAQFLIASGVSCLLAWFFNPAADHVLGWKELTLALALFLFPRVIQEARIIYPFPAIFYPAIFIAGGSLFVLLSLLYGHYGDILRSWLLAFRMRLGPWRLPVAGVVLLVPMLYRYVLGAGGYILYPNIRFTVILVSLGLGAYLLTTDPDHLVSLISGVQTAAWLVLLSAITYLLLLVVDDPFSVSWSEGNRFYDYSLIFGQDLYNYPGRIISPYTSPGRYILWGIVFLWKGLPIWVHRLWNVALLILPAILLAWLLTRKIVSTWRLVVFFWIAVFFILIAPLHPPFMLLLILVVAFAFQPSYAVRGASLVIASLYAAVSRWTWVVAPGAWGAIIDLLLHYPMRKGNWFVRLVPTALMAIVGAAPGLLFQAGYLAQLSAGETTTASQPLLWYRLLPNPTLGPGVFLLMVITTGPLVALLIYQFGSRCWKIDLWQSLGIWGALAGFLAAGLVISTKIGGGGDLHNLDMYIGTLILVTTLLLCIHSSQHADASLERSVANLPVWGRALLLFLVWQTIYPFTPFNPSAGYNKWLSLPTAAQSASALSTIRSAVDAASNEGEVLFMDQRQLLTFQYMPRIPFVPEYEKKYMMDQAMAGNASYFQPYYRDLADKRFKLIVTEVLRANLKNEGVFSEENDAWVTWVSAPTLCFYEPIMTDKVAGVQLLVPRAAPRRCHKFLQQVQP